MNSTVGKLFFLFTVVLGIISSSHFILAEIEGLGVCVGKGMLLGGVGNGIVDYYNLYTSTYSVYCEDNFL